MAERLNESAPSGRFFSRRIAILAIAIVALFVLVATVGYHRGRAHRRALQPARTVPAGRSGVQPAPELHATHITLARRDTFLSVLAGAGVTGAQAGAIEQAAQPILHPAHIESGHTPTRFRSAAGELRTLTYPIAPGRSLAWSSDADGGWSARRPARGR